MRITPQLSHLRRQNLAVNFEKDKNRNMDHSEKKISNKQTPCPICQATNASTFIAGANIEYKDPSQVAITDGSYGTIGNVVRCSECGLAYIVPRPTDSEITALYTALEDPEYHHESVARRAALQKVVSRLTRLNGGPGSLLEIGSATGLLLLEAREIGWSVEGVEPSRWAVSLAQNTYGLTVHCGTLETVSNFQRRQYDALVMTDVLEHVVHPRTLLESASNFVRQGGWLVIVTPDLDSVARRIIRSKWWHFRAAHLQYFSRSSLVRALDDAGFQIVENHRYAWSFSVDYWASRLGSYLPLMERIRKRLNCNKFGHWLLSYNITINFRDSFEVYAQRKV
jgi:2-polyprenyl-3-methyl-5-hydroxy-6-metoxy-1,4-benzoquinol methylase